MEEHEISCVVRDTNKIITNIGFNGKIYSVMQVAQWIVDKKYRFYILKEDGKKVYVDQRNDPTTKQTILTTKLDDYSKNELDSLPVC